MSWPWILVPGVAAQGLSAAVFMLMPYRLRKVSGHLLRHILPGIMMRRYGEI